MGAHHKVHESQELSRTNHCRQLLGSFLPEPESSSGSCVSVGDLTACQGDVDVSYDRLHHPQQLDRPKPAGLLLVDFMGCSVAGRQLLRSCSDAPEKSQNRALFLRIIQHSLEKSLLPLCRALLLAT